MLVQMHLAVVVPALHFVVLMVNNVGELAGFRRTVHMRACGCPIVTLFHARGCWCRGGCSGFFRLLRLTHVSVARLLLNKMGAWFGFEAVVGALENVSGAEFSAASTSAGASSPFTPFSDHTINRFTNTPSILFVAEVALWAVFAQFRAEGVCPFALRALVALAGLGLLGMSALFVSHHAETMLVIGFAKLVDLVLSWITVRA